MSVYDTKPVHFLSTISDKIDWILKPRRVWSTEENKLVSIDFLRLNFIDTYNSFMGYVDIADQLRGQYRPDV